MAVNDGDLDDSLDPYPDSMQAVDPVHVHSHPSSVGSDLRYATDPYENSE